MSLEKITDTLNLPKDIVMGASILHLIGQYEVYIENYKNIIEFNENVIKIQARSTKIIITGKHLHIEYFNNDDMKIKGRISDVSFTV
ncbi:MAG: YabP/YqfC family sporulation protein [Lachnospiraceae bacterium]|nr:YabP/YqfC family sporulation protein [Lachnospiraceae bacterium]